MGPQYCEICDENLATEIHDDSQFICDRCKQKFLDTEIGLENADLYGGDWGC